MGQRHEVRHGHDTRPYSTARHKHVSVERKTRYGTTRMWAVPDLDFRHVGLKSTARLEMSQSTVREKARNKHVSFFNESKFKIL